MFKIDPTTLYTYDVLQENLQRLPLRMDTFLTRTGLRKNRKFRDCFWGQELIDALNAMSNYKQDEDEDQATVLQMIPTRTPPLQKLRPCA